MPRSLREFSSKTQIDKCRSLQVDYYRKNGKSEFFGEAPTKAVLQHWGKYFASTGKSRGVMIDIGANVGQGFHVFQSMFPEGGSLAMVEPSPKTFETLKKNVKEALGKSSSSFQQNFQLYTFNMGLSNVVGKFKFYFNGANDGSNQASGLGQHGGGDFTEVEVSTLGKLVRNPEVGSTFSGPVDVLKIDTEGYDYGVLLGGENLLHRVRIIVYECSDTWKDNRGFPGATVKKAVDHLASFGFCNYKVGTRRLLRLDSDLFDPVYDNEMWWSDCMAVHCTDPARQSLEAAFGGVDASCVL